MFLRQLSSFGSSFLHRGRPALCGAGFRSSTASSAFPIHLCLIPAPPQWWTVRGFPPWPPRLLRPHPAAAAAYQVFSGHIARRSFNTSAGLLMERTHREPPHKRRKSAEEKGNTGEREAQTGGAAKDGGSKKEHRPLNPNAESFRPNHRPKDEDGGKHGAGKCANRESDRGKKRTEYVSKGREGERNRSAQRKDGAARDETPHRGNGAHQQGARKDSQPAAHSSSYKHKPNDWFQKKRDRSSDGGAPHGRAPPSNPWQVAGANRQPPPPGMCPPVRPQQVPAPMKGQRSELIMFQLVNHLQNILL